MEFTKKEKVNFDSFTIRKRILDETIEMMGGKVNYTDNDIKFNLMLSLMNEMVNENIIVYCLADEDKLQDKLLKEVEPFFDEQLKDEKVAQVFNELFIEVKEYLTREDRINTSVSGSLNKALEILASIDYEGLYNKYLKASDKEDSTTETVKAKEKLTPEEGKMENEKMKELINKFTKEVNATNN